MTLASVVG